MSVSHVPKFHTYRIKLIILNTRIYDIGDNNDNYTYDVEFNSLMMFHGWVKNRLALISIVTPKYNIHLENILYILQLVLNTHKSLSATLYIHAQNK